MAAKIDHFGSISQGYDRAQIGIPPPINNGIADVRPPENTPQRKQSLHVIIGDTLPLLLTHPRRGFRRFKNAVGDRNSDNSSSCSPQNAPILAPAPPADIKEVRLHTELEEKPKLPPLKALVSHPVGTVKSFIADKSGIQFSDNLAKSEVPHSASVNLLLQDHENSKASTAEESAEGLLRLTQLKQLRQDAFVRWTMDRHVREVRKVQRPIELFEQSPRSACQSWSTKAKRSFEKSLIEHTQYYIDEKAEWPQPSRKILASSFERIVVSSTQMQNWYMDLRAIAHWDNPRRTTIYAFGYILLVITGHVPSLILLLLIYKVLVRRSNPPDLQTLHESVACSEDRAQTPRHMNELIIQYGTEGWVDHAIDRVGPALYLKLEHIADVCELLQNFYEWRDPFRTSISLCLLTALWFVVTFVPTWILVKVSFFSVGLDFFVLSPIAYHYPEFRLLVSRFTWILWKVPTHADWAIARLQAEGKEHILRGDNQGAGGVESVSQNSKAPDTGPAGSLRRSETIGSYECESEPKGRLTVTTASVSFASYEGAAANWVIQLSEVNSLQKTSEATRTSDIYGLQFRSTAGLKFKVMGLEKRDEIFSQIVGYSDTQWKRIS